MGSKKFFPAIKYTARDFNSIKQELVEYAKRYYSDTFQDFNEAGFGALMLDTTAYIGDILSFYLDYNANESFLDTALEYENVLKLGKQMGYKFEGNPSSSGIATLYIVVQTNASGLGPDPSYIPILKRGTALASASGTKFILNEDIDFSNSKNEVVVARANETTGTPTHFAIKASGQVISGEIREEIVDIGEFEKLRKIELSDDHITEIISVVDAEGHEYYRVDYLSQDIIFKAITNRSESKEKAPNLLKPLVVPRRFITERSRDKTTLQFGYGSERDTTTDPLIDPATTVLNFHARDYVTDVSFDPTNLLGTDKLGISPANTQLKIVYRRNTTQTVNVGANALNTVSEAVWRFEDAANLNPGHTRAVQGSLEVSNESPILGDVILPTTEDLKIRIYDTFSSQNRAVTAQDYRALVYKMPPNFGAVKRVSIFRDQDSFKRNLNLYVISEDSNEKLETTNTTIKQNLKTWLNHSRMLNDTIDIFDAKIINVGINFTVVADLETSKYEILANATTAVMEMYSNKLEIGEPFFITDIYSKLNDTPGVIDAVEVTIIPKQSGLYSPTVFDLNAATSPDGRYINVPQNAILEVKYPEIDIVGSVK